MDNYCKECGTKLIIKPLKNEGDIPYCPTCNAYRFPMYNTAVSMIVINEETNKILLIQQYGKTSNILVAGYVNKGESLEHAVLREVKEETGLEGKRIKFNRTKYYEPSNTLMCNFTVFVENDALLDPNDEVDHYEWYSFDDARRAIKPNSLAAYFLNSYLDE